MTVLLHGLGECADTFGPFASRIRRERSAAVLRELMGETRTVAAAEANAGVGR